MPYILGSIRQLTHWPAAKVRPLCLWREDEDANWSTSCGEVHVFIDGGPADNRYRFCPYCGAAIVEERAREEPAEPQNAV